MEVFFFLYIPTPTSLKSWSRPPFRIFFFRFCLKSTFIFVQKKKKTKTKLKVRDVVTCGRSHVSGTDHVSGTSYFMRMLSSPLPFPVPFWCQISVSLCMCVWINVGEAHAWIKPFSNSKELKHAQQSASMQHRLGFDCQTLLTPNLYFNCSPPCMVFGNNELLSKLLL